MFCGNIDDTHLNFSSLNDFLYSDIFIWGFQGKIFYGYRYRLVRFEPNLLGGGGGGDLHIKDGEARRLVGSTQPIIWRRCGSKKSITCGTTTRLRIN